MFVDDLLETLIGIYKSQDKGMSKPKSLRSLYRNLTQILKEKTASLEDLDETKKSASPQKESRMENTLSSLIVGILNDSKSIEDSIIGVEIVEEEKLSALKSYMNELLQNPNEYYQSNDILLFSEFSPYFNKATQKIERKIDNVEHMMKKWAKLLKHMTQTGRDYIKAITDFGEQLIPDKLLFENNKEIQMLFDLLSQFLKEHVTYMEVFIKILESSIYR